MKAARRYHVPTVTDPITGRSYPLPMGGADDDVDALLARFGEDAAGDPLTDEELAQLDEQLRAELDDLADDDLDRLEEVVTTIESVAAEQDRRTEAAEERATRAAELRARVTVVPDDEEDEDGGSDDDVDSADDEEAPTAADTDEAPADTDEAVDTEPADDDAEEPVAVAASTPPATPARRAPARPTLRQAATRRPSSHTPRPKVKASGPVIVAAGDVPGVSAGSHLGSLDQVGAAFANKAAAIMGNRHALGVKFPVATFQVEYPTDRFLDERDGAARNREKVDAVVASLDFDSITAAGGLCAPVDVSYDLDVVSIDNRPIRDALTRFGATRGGLRFQRPPVLGDIGVDTDGTYTADDDTAVALWTEATDSDPGSNVKPCQTIVCGTEVEVLIDAMTKCLEVGNFSKRTFPEQFGAWWQLAGAAHARAAEDRLWDRMVTLGTAVTSGQVLGASRDTLAAVERVVAFERSRQRMSDSTPFRMIAPDWLRVMMRTDLLRQLPGDQTMSVSDAQLNQWFADRNITVTWSPDAGGQAITGTQGAGPVIGFPDTVEVLLFAEGTFTFLDGGELDFGMEIRDSTLNSTNDVQAFMETFENVAYRGASTPYSLTLDLCADGASSGTVDIDPCVSGS